MTELTFPGLGVHHGWASGEDGWGAGMELNLRLLNSLVQPTALSVTSTPPGSPSDGDAYIVGGSATGAWSGHDHTYAVYYAYTTTWYFYTPRGGFRIWNVNTSSFYYYNGSAWGAEPGTGSLSDAPSDGSKYGRLNGAWSAIAEFSNEQVDDRVAALLVAGHDITLTYNDSGNSLTIDVQNPVESIIVAVSDESTAIATGTGKISFRMPYAFTLSAVRSSLNTVSSSGNPTVDINMNGTSILSTTLSIDSGEKTSTTAATAAVISTTALTDDAEIEIDIDTAGTGAKGLKVYLIGRRT